MGWIIAGIRAPGRECDVKNGGWASDTEAAEARYQFSEMGTITRPKAANRPLHDENPNRN